jgi:hypothetical protein
MERDLRASKTTKQVEDRFLNGLNRPMFASGLSDDEGRMIFVHSVLDVPSCDPAFGERTL